MRSTSPSARAAESYRRMERAREYMNLPADEVAERINDAKRVLDELNNGSPKPAESLIKRLNPSSPEVTSPSGYVEATALRNSELLEEELEEEISLLQTFGCWENIGFLPARNFSATWCTGLPICTVTWTTSPQTGRLSLLYRSRS